MPKLLTGQRRGGRVYHEGRWVSSHWYSRHVGKAPAPYAAKRVRAPREVIWALFFLPAIPGCQEPQETRLVGVSSPREIEWIADMQQGYSDLMACDSADGLTTFFPYHPTPRAPALNF